MVKNEIIDKKELPITVKHGNENSVQMLGIKDMNCLHCGKKFYQQFRKRFLNSQITCSHCGKIHINKSWKKFDLRKFNPKTDILNK